MGNIERRFAAVRALALLALVGCSDEDAPRDDTCTQDGAASCDEGLVCEAVGEDFACLRPVIVAGRVFDATSTTPLASATVVGLDANGAARSRVAVSDAEGRFELPVSVPRDADGAPRADAITLRVAAADHQPFPTAPRTALPIHLEDARAEEADDLVYRIENAATDVALVPLPAELRGRATLSGRVAAEVPGGVLVVATRGDAAQSTAVSDRDGAFTLFNVPVGPTRIEGYRAGLALSPATVDVPAAGLEDVSLATTTGDLATVSGSLSIVNAQGGLVTSVILALASTFDPVTVRGESPAGLRATQVSGAFSIADVPPGRYAVLAAFENDRLVRDPDQGIAGTDVVFIDVVPGANMSLDQGFKVTEALTVYGPGAESVEIMPAGDLALSWADDSSEDGYELRVYDALGTLVHEDTEIAGMTGNARVTYMLDGSQLAPGMLYQFRVWSFREQRGVRAYVSASEDLRGVFEIAR